MKIAMASDHTGVELKLFIGDYLSVHGHHYEDLGTQSLSSVDYPHFASKVSLGVSSGLYGRGILICGTGLGMCIAANKYPQIRAAVVFDEYTARLSRSHNDANVMCFGARYLHPQRAIDFIKIWLSTPFEEGRHRNRIDQIGLLEKNIYG